MTTKARKPAYACTTMIAGKGATTDGSVIVAHSDDDVSDERVILVPDRDWDLKKKEEAVRWVYYDDCSLGHEMYAPKSKNTYNATELRRYIGKSRGNDYDTKDYRESIPLGSIPQVPHTYAYFDASYGIMNEHQLMIGECTCGAKVHPLPEPGKRIFYSSELSRVALERHTKALDAVKYMGSLIEQYGYYGTGETLLVGDPDEAWVMEMCGYDMDGKSGLWVAKRVPDKEFFVAANEFRIREINTPDVIHCKDLEKICQELGWYDPKKGPLDWLSTVSYGEYSNPYYSLRRVWRALTMAKPSANLSPWVENGFTKEYPFSVVPDNKLSVASIASIYRDHYEGTEFDMTVGRAAGPWGDPTRYENNPDKGDAFKLQVHCPRGAWERPISIYRCGMFWINQARKNLPDEVGGISWIGLDRPASNCLMPFFVGTKKLPDLMKTMKLTEFSKNSAWWAFNFVANYATLKYSYMIQDITELQQKLESEAYKKVYEIKDPGKAADFCEKNTANVIKAWWELSEKLIVKYNNGCITTEEHIMQKVDYPYWWLENAGYFDGPTTYYKKSAKCFRY